ncbi:MAG: hypothetical protein COT15_00025 [Candidatus Diapherotrites archaeon CG08_land_8_20_14_0_20_34_12]|nr:MAG: hypothetical protein COT15_00025 [Candidatus Diapherotrites archaeon CG08_land_8_20_14_0_20_34_12]
MIYGLLSALSFSGSQILDRHLMFFQKLDYLRAIAINEIMSLLILGIASLFFVQWDFSLFTSGILLAIVALIIFSSIDFLCYFKGLSTISVNEAQPYIMFSFFFTVILSVLIFPQEINNTAHLVTAIIASSVLILSNIEKKHLVISKGAIILLASSVCLAISKIFARFLVDTIDPIQLSVINALFLSVVLLIYLKPNFSNITKLNWFTAFLSTSTWILSLIFEYASYGQIGIINTIIILSSVPLIATIMDAILLKERLRKRTLLATIIITACIIYTILSVPEVAVL